MNVKKVLLVCGSLDYILIGKLLDKHFILKRINGEELAEWVDPEAFDLWIIDVAYLKLDLSVIEPLKKANLPVIALTSEPEDARNEKIRDAGCCACYVKPIRQELFIPFVEYWLKEYSAFR